MTSVQAMFPKELLKIFLQNPQHPHGIKVRLETGEVGRVKEILE